MVNDTKSYRAAWVIPVDRPPIRDGVITAQNDSIIAVDAYRSHAYDSGKLLDLGAVTIIPGLVNAHTHLEFGFLDKPLGQQGIPFTDWIRQIVQSRDNSNQQPEKKAEIIQRGLVESYHAGVWCLADIATTPVSVNQYVDNDHSSLIDRMTKFVFHEQLGRTTSQYPEKLEQLDSFLKSAQDNRLLTGISPHAPYSVHPQLLDLVCERAVKKKIPLAMHVAETNAERDLLEQRKGPFVDLLQDFGIWDESSFLPTRSILDYLKRLANASRSLVIHGNYLDGREIDFVASVADRMSVVYCPRTHYYFKHSDYPLEMLLQAGICVAIGTDSRASNPDLNLFEELKFISRSFPGVCAPDILRMGTLNGATALGIDRNLGSISNGKQAALCFLNCPAGISQDLDPFEWIFEDCSRCFPVNLDSPAGSAFSQNRSDDGGR